MDLQNKVKDSFKKKSDLKVLFFFDKDKEYLEDIQNWNEDGVKLVTADQSMFSIKYQLEFQYPLDKIFLYFPFSKPKQNELKHFVLLDIFVANKELQIDDETDFMEEFGLQAYQRNLVKKYIRELKIKKVQRVLSKILNHSQFEERTIVQGLISYYLGFIQIVDPTLCIAKLSILASQEQENELLLFTQKVNKIEVYETVLRWFKDYLELDITELNKMTISSAVKKLKYNILTLEIPETSEEDPYDILKITRPATLNRLQSLMADWQNESKLSEKIDSVFYELAADIREETILKIYGFDADYAFYSEPLVGHIFDKISSIIDYNPDQVLKLLHKLISKNGRKEHVRLSIDCFYNIANFFKKINSINSFVLNKSEDYLLTYINDYEKIDFYYRKAVLLLQRISKQDFSQYLSLDKVTESLHQKYENYLKELNSQWLKCMLEKDFNFNSFKSDKQYDFFNKYVRDVDQKTVVIISDALRYEAATELMNELHADTKSQAKIFGMITSIPSHTSLGMANLLPNNGITISEKGFFIDEISTDGLTNREKILQTIEPASKTIQFSKLEQLTKAEARDLFKNKIVYVYHNVIDAIGDDRKTENKVYEAIEQAIEELKVMIKKIHSSWNVSRILVTADHGFIYHHRDLPEAMYEKMPKEDEVVLAHNRFSIIKASDEKNPNKISLRNVSNIDSNFQVIIPRAINRFKRQGSGVHFVHGGATLQELIVPVIISSRKREEITEKVKFTILNRELAIISGAIKLKVLQNEPISQTIKSRSVVVGLYDSSNELISNETDMILDSTSELPTGRSKEVILNLTSKAGRISICNLQIFDEKDDPDKLNPLMKQKVINKTLIETDF